jgi:hypothetical protein
MADANGANGHVPLAGDAVADGELYKGRFEGYNRTVEDIEIDDDEPAGPAPM